MFKKKEIETAFLPTEKLNICIARSLKNAKTLPPSIPLAFSIYHWRELAIVLSALNALRLRLYVYECFKSHAVLVFCYKFDTLLLYQFLS